MKALYPWSQISATPGGSPDMPDEVLLGASQ